MLLATDPWLSDVANWIKAFHTHFFLEALFLYADICIHKTRILSIYIVDRSSVVWLYLLNKIDMNISSVQFSSSVVSDSLRPHESQHARPPCPSPTPGVSLRLTSIESVMPSSHLILCRPLLLLPPIHPSIRVFSNESTLLMRWPKDWSFSLSIIPSKNPRADLLQNGLVGSPAVQGTLKSLLQHHSSKASTLRAQPSSQSNSHIHT